jgi:hypothetical protein
MQKIIPYEIGFDNSEAPRMRLSADSWFKGLVIAARKMLIAD